MAVLSHALLLIASLLAARITGANLAACQGVPSRADMERHEAARAPLGEISVRTQATSLTREVAVVRVLGRCVVKAAPENPRPVLFGSFAAETDDPDDENLANTRAEAKPPFARPTAVGTAPTDMYVPRAPLSQLDRPPRV